jgi:D-alanyl-D-alanine carboxypeptidase
MAVKAFENDLIKRFCSASRYTLSPTNMAGERTIVTSNMLLNPNSNVYYKYAGAGKTGYTSKAGRCLVSTAKYNGYEYLAIVLNANTAGGARYDFIDIANMFRWAFNNFEYKTVFESTTPIAEAPIRLSAESDHLPICFAGGLKTILPKEADASTIKYELHLNEEVFTATVNKGDVVGTADIFYAEEKIGTLDLAAGQTVKASALLVFLDAVKNFLTSSFMKVVYIIIASAVVIFILAVLFLNRGKKKTRKVKYVPMKRDELDDFDIK